MCTNLSLIFNLTFTVLLCAFNFIYVCSVPARRIPADQVEIKPLIQGLKVSVESAPWNAALYNYSTKTFLCSGSLITPSVILTAAHCAILKSNEYAVLLASSSADYDEAVERNQGAQVARVRKIIVHEDYIGGPEFQHDIALFFLEKPAVLTDVVKIIKLPTEEQSHRVDEESLKMRLTGLGSTGNDQKSHHLFGLNVVTFHCARLNTVLAFDQEIQLCASPTNFSEAICGGDSGGGMHLEFPGSSKEYFIHGVLSVGLHNLKKSRDCYQNAVFTKVFAFIPWIHEQIEIDNQPKVKVVGKKKPKPEPISSSPLIVSSNASIAYMVRNVGSNLCLDTSIRLTYKSKFSLTKCYEDLDLDQDEDSPTRIRTMEALRRPALLLMETWTHNVTIGAAFEERLEEDSMGRKGLTCAWAGYSTAQSIWVQTDICEDYHNPWHRFDLVWADDDKSKFLIRHRMTERCLKPEGVKEGSPIFAFLRCDPSDPNFLWEREVWPICGSVVKALSQIERSAKLWR